jgi:hypothetical protein
MTGRWWRLCLRRRFEARKVKSLKSKVKSLLPGFDSNKEVTFFFPVGGGFAGVGV